MIILYASAPSGAGKTHRIVDRACELAQKHERALILQPTKELINKTVQKELLAHPNPPPHYVFHGDAVFEGSVAGELTRFFREAEDVGQVAFAIRVNASGASAEIHDDCVLVKSVEPYDRHWSSGPILRMQPRGNKGSKCHSSTTISTV
jgi:hypothetical protein